MKRDRGLKGKGGYGNPAAGDSFRDSARALTERALLGHNLLVFLCGLALGATVFILFAEMVPLPFRGPTVEETGIVSLITVTRYPKQQDIFYYYTGILFIAGISLLCWIEWVRWSSRLSTRFRMPLERIGRITAWTFLPALVFPPLTARVPSVLFPMLSVVLILLFKGAVFLVLSRARKAGH